MIKELRTGTIIEVDSGLFGFGQAVILYLIPPDYVEVTPFIDGKIPRAGGTISITDVVKVINHLSPKEFTALEGKYTSEYLLQCLNRK
jgi:hypothetical protein